MFDLLKKFIADTTSRPDGPVEYAESDFRLAAVALLVHVANVDGRIDATERIRLRQIIEERFALDAAATTRLIAKAEESDREAIDFFHFTNVLKRTLDDNGRHRIIEMMWDIAFADGDVTEFEENVVWRIASLLGVSNRDRVMLRREASEDPRPTTEAGPWAGSPRPNTKPE